jgi:hypothetical protein
MLVQWNYFLNRFLKGFQHTMSPQDTCSEIQIGAGRAGAAGVLANRTAKLSVRATQLANGTRFLDQVIAVGTGCRRQQLGGEGSGLIEFVKIFPLRCYRVHWQ